MSSKNESKLILYKTSEIGFEMKKQHIIYYYKKLLNKNKHFFPYKFVCNI